MPDTDTTATGAQPLPPTKSKSNPLPGEQIAMTEAERASKFSELLQLWTEAAWPAAEVEQRKRDWAEYNCSDRPSARRWPIQTFDGKAHSANMRFPLLRRYTDAHVAQISEAVFAERPFIAVSPDVGDPDPDRAKRVEQRLDHVYESIIKYPQVANKWIRRTDIEGVGILHIPYRKREKFLLKRAEAGSGEQEGTFSTVYDAPKPEVVPLDRFRLYPNNAESIDEAWGVFYSYRLNLSKIEKGRKPGKGPDGEKTPPKYVITDEQWDVLRKANNDESTEAEEKPSTGATNHTRVNAVDVYCRYEYVKGEQALPVVFTFLPDHNLLIRATPCSTGDVRPFVAKKFRETGNSFVGLPINRVIDQIVEAVNGAWNQMDNQARLRHLLALSPFFTPGMDFDMTKPWLGAPVAVADTNGVRWVDIPADMDALPRIQFLLDMLEGSIGVNANALGVQLASQRTATEVNTMNTQGARIFREQIELSNASDVDAVEVVCWQYYLNGPSEEQYLAKPNKQELAELMPPQQTQPVPPPPADGGAPFPPDGAPMGDAQEPQNMPVPEPPEYITRTVRAEDFAPGLTFAIRGSGAHLNRAQELQEALETRAAFMEDPLVMADAGRLWELDSKVLTAQRHPDPEGILGPKPDPGESVMQLLAKAAPHQPAAPEKPLPDATIPAGASVFANSPPDAQAAYLEKIGLPGDLAAQGYRDGLAAMQKDHDVATRPEPVAPTNGKGAMNG